MHCFFFFFNDTATTEIYTLSLHDALPICSVACWHCWRARRSPASTGRATSGCCRHSARPVRTPNASRSEEHTSELQSQSNLVCRLLLEKKKHNISLLLTESDHKPQHDA